MADILDIGQKAQDFIDNTIILWIKNAKNAILGNEPDENTLADLPFYAGGTGVWYSYNSNISNVEPNNYGWSFAFATWALYTDETPTDLKLDLDVSGIENPNRPQSWNDAIMQYWTKDIIDYSLNEPYIVNNQIQYIGYEMTSRTDDPSSVCGFRIEGSQLNSFNEIINATWYDYSHTSISSTNRARICDQAGTFDYSVYRHNDAYQPISADALSPPTLNLPRCEDSFWYTFIPYTDGNTTEINNFYDQTKTHNETNNYYTENGYTNYYNEYNVTLPSGLGFDIGVGPAGIVVAPVVPITPVIAPTVNFDDLVDLLTPIVDDLNNNGGLDTTIVIHDLDYYLGYEDMGDFYIEPLHQYDKLSAAPTFDGTVEFGDIPKVIGESANTYLDLLGTGVSALLCGVFITALIVRKMGR